MAEKRIHGLRARRAGGTSGFTLIELMVAIGVLMVAVLTAFSSQVTSMNLVHTSRETNTAMGHLQGAMEQVLLLQTDDIPIPDSPFEAETVLDTVAGMTLQNEQIVATYPGYTLGSDEVPDPLQIVLTATWNDFQGRPRTLSLSSMKAK